MSSSIGPASPELHPAVKSLAPLLAQTPPGQVAKVYHDLRVLLERSGVSGASDQLRAAAWPVLSQYNTQQLITVKAPSPSTTTTADTDPAAQASVQPLIISDAGALAEEQAPRFVDPRAQTSYAFDPLRLRLADPKPIVVNDAFERLRAALDKAATTYTSHYYPDGVTSTFVQVTPDPESEQEVTTPAPNEESTTVDVAEPETAAQESVPEQDGTEGATPNAESEQPVTTGPEAHAGGAEDVEDVARAHHQVEDSQEADHDVAGEQTDANEADADATSAVNAAVDQAEAVAEQDAPASETKDGEAEEGSLADSLQQTHISPEGADQGPETEAIETEQPVQQPSVPKGGPTYTIHIVGNRYNLTNFWAGRWRSTYVLSFPAASEVEETPEQVKVQGKVQVQVHYFEEGNIQLSAEHAPVLPVATQDLSGVLSGEGTDEAYATLADAVLRAIKADEQSYHAALESTLIELSDKTFRALRRQLPVTKQKVDWDRAVSYNLAGDLAR